MEPTMHVRCCERERGGCGKLFTPLRKFQKACETRCASSMIKVVTEELRQKRRQAALHYSEPLTPAERKKKRRRARQRLKNRH